MACCGWFTGRPIIGLPPSALLDGGVDVRPVVDSINYPFPHHCYFPVRIHFALEDVGRAYWRNNPNFNPIGYRGSEFTYVQAFDMNNLGQPRQVNVAFSSPSNRPLFAKTVRGGSP